MSENYDEATCTPKPGYRWCPECNGNGEVTVMQANPNLDEETFDCTFDGCAAGHGIVPTATRDVRKGADDGPGS